MPFPPHAPHLPVPLAGTDALPLRGTTLLVVEDSRYTCDALRLFCIRSGARMRRAETLAGGRAYLGSYHPNAVIVDLGLPDGPGEALIAELARTGPPTLGMSGDPDGEALARAAGAAGFLGKPLASLATFQKTVLTLLRSGSPAAPDQPAPAPEADPLAFRDDLARVAGLIGGPQRRYAAGFLRNLGRAAGDVALEAAAADAASDPGRAALARLVADRLARPDVVA